VAKPRVIGLDIGTTHVRAAEVEFTGTGPSGRADATLVRIGARALPPGAVRDGEVAEPHTVATALKQLWSEQKFGSKDVVIGIGNQRVLVRDLDLPAMPQAQLKASLPFQVQDSLPMAIEDAILDYFPTSSEVGPNGPIHHGLLVAATRETVQANARAVTLAGLRPVQVDLNAFAVARVQARGTLAAGVWAFVDIGARVTNVTIVIDGTPQFVRILPSGGQDVTDAVANTLNIAHADAEQIKREVGVGLTVDPHLENAREVVREVTSSLVEAVRNTMVYFASGHPGQAVQQIVLSGGGSFLPGLGQYLASSSRLPVALGEPLTTLRKARTVTSTPLEPTVVTAVGLAFGIAA
jgi:type IV pilus assembly protein PilM